jgi:hypothetical protein
LVTGIHPSKPLSRDELEINAHIAVLDFDFVGHIDHVKLLRDHPVKVYKRLCNPV